MLDSKYIKYYIFGYLNMYYCDMRFSYDCTEGSFKQHRIREALLYVGIKIPFGDSEWIPSLFSFIEAISSTVLVFFRCMAVLFVRLFVKRQVIEGKTLAASLSVASFRMKRFLESVRPSSVHTLRIPFIRNEYKENEINILSAVSFLDILMSLSASWRTVWTMYVKYRHRDPLFRSCSSFEYYLTCSFVKNTEGKNRFIYYNTYDRWAFLMCNTTHATFIQHGKLMDTLSFIRVGTPDTAVYLNKNQENVLENVLFKSVPENVRFRSSLTFTCDNLLINNGKKNVLLVCWSNNIDKEWEICRLIGKSCNLYIKPHPGDRDRFEYSRMARRYDGIVVPKTGYPRVDTVISYDSTLADEYEDVNVKVIRYDLLDNLNNLEGLI